jgi:hypothetical protein
MRKVTAKKNMKVHSKPPPQVIYWVRIPLTFTYRSLPGLHIVETHSRELDLPILSWHRKEIERLVTEVHLSPEQALESLINAYIEEKRAQFHKEEPEYHVTITISGVPIYSKELLKHLKR